MHTSIPVWTFCVCPPQAEPHSITSCIRCNTCVTFCGTREQAKSCGMYTCNYCSKTPTAVNHANPIMEATLRQMEKRKSKAKDAGTPDRNFQFMATHMTNLFTKSMEHSDTQAAAKLLGIESEYKSHKFWYFRFDALRT